MEGCHTCELVARRDAGQVPIWNSIYRTPHWDVAHAFNTSLRGWLVLVARRHIAAIHEMTEDEAVELGPLIRHLSIALKVATGCEKTYVAQFAEAQGHNHVHFHIMPRMPNQPDERRGPRIFGYLGPVDDECIGEMEMNEVAAAIHRTLLAL